MNSRSWGVSEQAQLSKGTFVEAFECLVSVQNENFSLTKNKISSNQLLSKFFGKILRCKDPRYKHENPSIAIKFDEFI